MLIVISGPIASGKSTLARALARHLETSGGQAVAIDVDVLYDMLRQDSGGPKDDEARWTMARHAASALTNGFADDGIETVIVEGSFLEPIERREFADRLRPGLRPVYVTLQVPFDEALRRAQMDPTRGASRDPAFLRRYFNHAELALAHTPADDLVIDTERLTVDETVAVLSRHLRTKAAAPE